MILSKIKWWSKINDGLKKYFLVAFVSCLVLQVVGQTMHWQPKIKLKNTDELYAFTASDTLVYALRLDYRNQVYAIDCSNQLGEVLWTNDTLLKRNPDADFYADQFEVFNTTLFATVTEFGKEANKQILIYDLIQHKVLEYKQLPFDVAIKAKVNAQPNFYFSENKALYYTFLFEDQLIKYTINSIGEIESKVKSVSPFDLLPPDKEFVSFKVEDFQLSNSGNLYVMLQFTGKGKTELWMMQIFQNGIELLTPLNLETVVAKQVKLKIAADDLCYLGGFVFTPKNEIVPFAAKLSGTPLQLESYSLCNQKFSDSEGRSIEKELENNLLQQVELKLELSNSKLFLFFEWKEIEMGKGLEVAFEPIVVHRYADVWLCAFDRETLNNYAPIVIMKDQQTTDDSGLFSSIGYFMQNDELTLIYNDNFNNNRNTAYKDLKLMDNVYDSKTVMAKYNGVSIDRNILSDSNSKKSSCMPSKLFFHDGVPCVVFSDDVSYRVAKFELK